MNRALFLLHSPFTQSLPTYTSRSAHIARFFSSTTNSVDGVVVGRFKSGKFTSLGDTINERTKGKLNEAWELTKKKGSNGEGMVLYGALEDLPRIAVVGMGNEGDNILDAVRQGAANGARLLKSNGARKIGIDTTLGSVYAAAEGCTIGIFKYDKLKTVDEEGDNTPVEFSPYIDTQKVATAQVQAIQQEWNEGVIVGNAQNMAKELAETPANLMTPSLFANNITNVLNNISTKGTVEVTVRDKSWMENNKMGCLLGVSQGSIEEPRLVEVHYKNDPNPKAKPLVFVGKGVTFDSGGISIKPAAGMAAMKGDMQGAAIVMSTVRAIAELNLPINVIAIAPLCENMPSGNAIKPGDVLTAMNKKTVEVDNTDAEGRLILADALHYAQSFGPHTLIDIATLTGAIDVALGHVAAGAFTPSNGLWGEILLASLQSGERVWRMPLFKEYRKMLNSHVADICNVSSKRSAGACTAAMFLQEFVKLDRWLHLDIAGVMQNSETAGHQTKGMSGKQVRTLVEFARQYDTREQKLKEQSKGEGAN